MGKIKVTRMNTKTGETFTRLVTKEQYNNIKISQGLYIIVDNPVETIKEYKGLLKEEKRFLDRYLEMKIISASYIYTSIDKLVKILKGMKQGKFVKQEYYNLYTLRDNYLERI